MNLANNAGETALHRALDNGFRCVVLLNANCSTIGLTSTLHVMRCASMQG